MTTELKRTPAVARVLALPDEARKEFFDPLLAAAHARLGWQVHIPRRPSFQALQSWEGNPQAVEAIDALISASELASGVSAGRLLLMGEGDIGRGFSEPSIRQANGALARRALRDNAEPFLYLRQIFAFARDTLDSFNPDFVLAGDWTEPLSFAIYMLARQRRLRCITNRPSQIWAGRYYWTEDLFFNLAARKLFAEKRAANVSVSARAQAYLGSRRDEAGSRKAAVPDVPYIYFALQCEPARALSALSPFWANQYNSVTLLSAALPAGYRLVVQDDSGNRERRPQRFLEDLARLPNVTLVDGSQDALSLVAKAAMVAAVNDGSGWDALMLGRRTIALTDTFYDECGLAHRLRKPELLAPTVVELCRSPAFADPASAERALGWLIDAEWETSLLSKGATAMDEAVAALGDVQVCQFPAGSKVVLA